MSQIDIDKAADRILGSIYGYNSIYTRRAQQPSFSQITGEAKYNRPFSRISQMDLILKSDDSDPLYVMAASENVNMGFAQLVDGHYIVPDLEECRGIISGDEPIDEVYRCITDAGDIVAFTTFTRYMTFVYGADGGDYGILFGTDESEQFIHIIRKNGELYFAQ